MQPQTSTCSFCHRDATEGQSMQTCLCSSCINEIRGLQSRVRALEEQVSALQTDLRRFQMAETKDDQSPSTQVCEAPLDSLAVGFDDGRIGIASLVTEKVDILSDVPHEDAVSCVHSSGSGEHLASSCDDGNVALHDRQSRGRIGLMHHTEGRQFVDGVAALAVLVLGDGSVASGAEDCNVKVWSSQGQLLRTLSGHTSTVHGLAEVPGGQQLVSCSADSNLRLWSLSAGTCEATLQGHESKVYACALVSSNAQRRGDREGMSSSTAASAAAVVVASCSHDETVRLWSLPDCRCTDVLRGHTGAVFSVVGLQGGDRVASGAADATVRIWRVSDGACLSVLHEHKEPVRGLASLGASRLASCSDDGTILEWDTGSGSCVGKIMCPAAPCCITALPGTGWGDAR